MSPAIYASSGTPRPESRKEVFETFKYGLKLAIQGVDEVSVNVYTKRAVQFT